MLLSSLLPLLALLLLRVLLLLLAILLPLQLLLPLLSLLLLAVGTPWNYVSAGSSHRVSRLLLTPLAVYCCATVDHQLAGAPHVTPPPARSGPSHHQQLQTAVVVVVVLVGHSVWLQWSYSWKLPAVVQLTANVEGLPQPVPNLPSGLGASCLGGVAAASAALRSCSELEHHHWSEQGCRIR